MQHCPARYQVTTSSGNKSHPLQLLGLLWVLSPGKERHKRATDSQH